MASQTEYGWIEVVNNTKQTAGPYGGSDTYYGIELKHDSSGVVQLGKGKTGKQQARTLAAVLGAADVTDLDCLPPGMVKNDEMPDKHSNNEWEEWASDTNAVPARIATAGKAAVAGWLKVVHRERESWIANRMGVSESTVRQYLSDLREGRR